MDSYLLSYKNNNNPYSSTLLTTEKLQLYLVIGGIIYLVLRHQRNLKSRAFLMQEAIRNGDYSFRLSTKGLLFGERALQQALNDMENDIGRLVAQHEVESWQRLDRKSVV